MVEMQEFEIKSKLTELTPIPTHLKPRLKAPKSIRAVLFDIYGTLLISGGGDIGHARLNPEGSSTSHTEHKGIVEIREIFEDCGYKVSGRLNANLVDDRLRQEITGRHRQLHTEGIEHPEVDIRDIWKKTLKGLWEDKLLLKPPSTSSVDLLALRYELAISPVWPMPGFPAIIRELRDIGLRAGIVSNAQFYTPLILQAICGKTISQIGFEDNLCSWSYKLSEAKPSISIFKPPLAQLGRDQIRASEVLYVGNDMLNDIATASGVGCKTVLFAGDRRSLRLRESSPRAKIEPDMIITRLSELRILGNREEQ